ncbi:MAG: xanthine dehydrogenase family protein molybdopterin-binding subunit [Coriobacteriales bacterium]|jgi:CO/xanthine dehydrogenase Mo-binding subunit|nr:xanthine dehydrogenase family protein molybdopterin-binding subunit [Coriobacteriales bacterium]
MHPISQPVVKKDHTEKMAGSAEYVGDFYSTDMLHARFVRSPHPHARILEICYPELPEGYCSVDHRDVLGENIVHVVEDDSPVFEVDEVFYVGDPVAMIIGPDPQRVKALAAATEVRYEVLSAILDIDDSDTVFFDYHYGRGDCEDAFSEADKVYEEQFSTGYQEQAYLETQGMSARYEDGLLTVHGSLQCPYYVHGAIAKATGLPKGSVRVIQDYTGGGFGGKEAYPSFLAAQLGVAAMKVPGKDVRVVYDRREDMEFTSKRHPSRCTYRAAVKDGRVTALEIDVRFNSGAFTTLSPVVLQRGIIAAPGVYHVPSLKVRGRGLRTHTVPTGAYRGFGAPQTFFAIERLMDHIAADLGQDPLDFKLAHAAKKGDPTSTSGIYHYEVPLPEMVDKVCEMSDYRAKRAAYAKEQGRRYRNGIGIALWFHGCGFTGSGERDFIKAVVGLHKHADGTVEVLACNSDIGQGIKTTFSKVVAAELGIPYDQVSYGNPDTSRVPDSGPTVASRSLMTVGELLRRAAARLREEWVDGQEQSVEEHYHEPDFMLPFSLEDFSGDAYPTYAWGVSAIELRYDSLTGANDIVGCWSSFDVGTPIDLAIVTGQMEGGVLQGLGYSSMEQMATDANGRIRNNSYSDYIIPTSADVGELAVSMHVVEFPFGPYGAKGAGELPLVGIAPAFVEAAEQALGARGINHIPLKAEEALEYLGAAQKEAHR